MAAGHLWSRDEIRHAVDAYALLHRKFVDGESYDVGDVRQTAVSGPLIARSHRSFDMRMCNISHILASNGETWVPEFPPLSHVGGNVELEILDLLTDPKRPERPPEGRSLRESKETPIFSVERVAAADTPTTIQGLLFLQSEDSATTLEALAIEGLRRMKRASGSGQLFNAKSVKSLVRRLGLDGAPPCSLQEAADLVGFSRQRVSQLQQGLDGQLADAKQVDTSSVPQILVKAIELALRHSIESLPDLLRRAGFCEGFWSIESLAVLARIYGLQHQSGQMNERKTDHDSVRSVIVDAVWRGSGKSGFAHLTAIWAEVRKMLTEAGLTTNENGPEGLRDILESCEEILCLPKDVYYVKRSKSTVVNTTQRMLQVSEPLHVPDIRAGLRRRLKFRQVAFNLTSEILTEFYRLHSQFDIADDGWVKAASELPELDDTLQLWVVREIEASDYGLLTRNQIIERAVRARKNANSIRIYLSYGEQIAHDVRGFFYPIGRRPSEDHIRQALDVADATVKHTSQDWRYEKDEATLTLTLELGHTVVSSGVLSADAQARSPLELIGDSRYPLLDEDGDRHGSLWRSEAFDALGGLSTFLAHKYAEPGDHLRVQFDLSAQIARGVIGGAEVGDPLC